MRLRRSSVLVGAARKMGASLAARMASRYSPASSMVRSVASTPSTPRLCGAAAQKRSSPQTQDRVEIGEDDEPASAGAQRAIPRASASTSASVVPLATARWLARSMTGPSASGSLKGTPSSSTSAPASMAASAMCARRGEVGIADGEVDHEAGFLSKSDRHSSVSASCALAPLKARSSRARMPMSLSPRPETLTTKMSSGSDVGREADGFGDGVRAFERGHDAFGAGEHHGRVERLLVGGGGVGRRGRSRAWRRAPGQRRRSRVRRRRSG